MPVDELRKLVPAELAERENELREQVARLRMRRNARRLEKPSELIAARRELARLLTVKRQAEIAASRGESA
jgi:ribosomal protein L29